ncbi:hypothetical protein FGIG_07886 [Fasciola gigantica]|uniref:SS18 N-terminal domain-containing protein n=1 Tax=Fasciola gigantica TaxID=46835 RepID=A0A504YK36_FASGI|nr:hypothetical protein FGIG_07886 [Fasciola gigantica]
MSAVFCSDLPRQSLDPESTGVKRLLDENEYMIQLISELSRKGNFVEAAQMQQILQRNLTYLVSLVIDKIWKKLVHVLNRQRPMNGWERYGSCMWSSK